MIEKDTGSLRAIAHMNLWLVAAVLIAVGAAAATAQPANMTVSEAHAGASSGKIVLIDIRAPKEWAQSGVPAIGKTITMYQPTAQFINALKASTDGDPNKPIALICAKGGRTLRMQRALQKAGMKNVINVVGGMFGTWRHRSWLKAGLPVREWSKAKQ